jgi:hypothetical protein
MNCKPGELAIVIRGPYAGVIVEVLYAEKTDELSGKGIQADLDVWMCESKGDSFLIHESGLFCSIAAFFDEELCPIRPGELEDETPTVRELEQV